MSIEEANYFLLPKAVISSFSLFIFYKIEFWAIILYISQKVATNLSDIEHIMMKDNT